MADEVVKKVCLLGEAGVGKTSLIRRFVHNTFDPEYLSTIGALVSTKELERGGSRVTLQIWDIAGQQTSRSLDASHIRGSQGAIAVCDITRRATLDSLPAWLQMVRRAARDVPVVVLANKVDLWNEREFAPEDVPRALDVAGALVLESSAKTGANVERAFQELAARM